MNDKEVMSELWGCFETLLLRTMVQQVLLDRNFPGDWREIAAKQEILNAPLLRAQIASLRAAILGDHPTSVSLQDWQEIVERLIRSVEDNPESDK